MDWRKKLSSDENGSYYKYNFEWIQKMNNAIAYIESRLDEEIDYSEAAKIAYCSVYHFQRFFSFIAEIPLSEYIRRRRLTIAAFELQNSNAKIIDIAIRCGYESPEAFTRAFKSMHGITPRAAKNKGTRLKAYPCITFHMSIKGDAEMNYRIEQKEDFKMFGAYIEISTVDNQNFTSVPKFWETCRANGTMAKIREAASLDCNEPLHAASYNCTDTSHSYMIGYFVPANGVSQDFFILSVPAATWAVFSTEELSMQEAARQSALMWKRIFTEWFATSGYELANAPELELHHKKGDNTFITEIWIPICKK